MSASVRIFANGTIFTGLRGAPWVNALAIRDADVLATGRLSELRGRFPGAVEDDLAGGTVLPGLVDAHNHFLSTGESLASIDLRYPGVASGLDVLHAIRDAAAVAP